MRNIINIISLFLMSVIIFCTSPDMASAQDSASAAGMHFEAEEEDWEHESALYRGFGWGLFGTGLAMVIAGIVVFAVSPAEDYDIVIDHDDDDDDIDIVKRLEPGAEKAVLGLTLGGAALVITGSVILIVDAVKFYHYRDQYSGFSWRPELYLSPEMTGLGISGRF